MKKLISILSILLFFTSCTTGTPTRTAQGTLSSSELEDDLSWIRDEDFVPVREVPFSIRQDFFQEENPTNAMVRESIERTPEAVLRRISSSEDLVGRIVSLCYRGDFARAEQEMDSSYSKLKSHPSYWNQVGTCFLIRGKHRQAQLYYNKALDIDKKYAPAINNLGVIHFREGSFQRALNAFQEASELNTFSLTPSFNVAILQLKYGFVDQAEQVFQALRRQNQEEPEILHALATIALFKNDMNRSIGIYRLMDRQHLSQPSVGLNYAVALKLAGRVQDARNVLAGVNSAELAGLEEYYRQVEQYLRD
jgi:Tfp pilus assembly protein PilF